MERRRAVWINGEMRDAAQPALAADNAAWLTGRGVFATLLGRDGEPAWLSRHLGRLAAGAELLGLEDAVLDAVTLEAALRTVLRENGLVRGLARLRITLGPSITLVSATEFAAYSGSAAVVTSPFVRNERSALAGIKSTSYAENLLALEEAKRRGADEAILANTRGELCEGATSNLFLVEPGAPGRVITPPLASGCLPGVMRELVLERGREAGLSVQEEPILLVDLARCREAFLTSSLRGVQPVGHIDGRELGAAGSTTQRIRALLPV